MAIDRHIQEPSTPSFSREGEGGKKPSHQKRKSIPVADGMSETTQSCGFECNICLDLVHEPVVTFCGHLYCWPCIYKWIHAHTASADEAEQPPPQCPVCKAQISQKALVPLYGHGQTRNPSKPNACHLDHIPQRPSTISCESQNLLTAAIETGSHPFQQHHHGSHPQQQHRQLDSYGGTTTITNPFNPTVGMFGEAVYARLFGNSQATVYAYPNYYHLVHGSNPRARRRVMETDKSLGRVCFFLCCCTILCLLLF